MDKNLSNENQNSHIPSSGSQKTPETSAAPSFPAPNKVWIGQKGASLRFVEVNANTVVHDHKYYDNDIAYVRGDLLDDSLQEIKGCFLAMRAAADVCDGSCDDAGEPCVWRLAQHGTELARAALALTNPSTQRDASASALSTTKPDHGQASEQNWFEKDFI